MKLKVITASVIVIIAAGIFALVLSLDPPQNVGFDRVVTVEVPSDLG